MWLSELPLQNALSVQAAKFDRRVAGSAGSHQAEHEDFGELRRFPQGWGVEFASPGESLSACPADLAMPEAAGQEVGRVWVAAGALALQKPPKRNAIETAASPSWVRPRHPVVLDAWLEASWSHPPSAQT